MTDDFEDCFESTHLFTKPHKGAIAWILIWIIALIGFAIAYILKGPKE